MKTMLFTIQGVHCAGFAQTIRHALERLDGVQACSAAFDEGSARVSRRCGGSK